MKLVRFGQPGAERPGVLDADGEVRDLSAHCKDLDLREPGLLARLAGLDIAALPRAAPTRLGAPVAFVGKFIGVGLNYRDHALEAGLPIPMEPVIFSKAASCVTGPNDGIVLPPGSTKTDWEVELGIVIGRRAAHVTEAAALDHIAGYLVVNDVSEREYQNERGGTWDKGKGCDTFGPIGPWLVTPDEIPDPQALDLWLDVNGAPMQRGATAQMIFSCVEIVAYLSRFMTLLPGDVITTGTPPGVGLGLKPPRYLAAGDVVRLGISGLGEQQQVVRG
jgi:2-keto-4-pentenoate hydratase/2-oxohepta-3-ene-1,7-dioic acid hydratase in catechol pathway